MSVSTQSRGPIFKDLIGILDALLDRGLVDVVKNAITSNEDWLASQHPPEKDRYLSLQSRLMKMTEIEAEHGEGCHLDLDHPTTQAMIRWGRLAAVKIENAEKFKTSDHCK